MSLFQLYSRNIALLHWGGGSNRAEKLNQLETQLVTCLFTPKELKETNNSNERKQIVRRLKIKSISIIRRPTVNYWMLLTIKREREKDRKENLSCIDFFRSVLFLLPLNLMNISSGVVFKLDLFFR